MQLTTSDYQPLTQGPVNFQPPANITVNQLEPYSHIRPILKICLAGFIFIATVAVSLFAVSKATLASNLQKVSNQQLLFSTDLQMTEWQDLGQVSEPMITLPVQTISGYDKVTFLLDSGAVVSSLPREMASTMGQDLAFLKRTTFKGFGNQTSFAYHSNMTLKLDENIINLPVVFTENAGTQALLGRKGFFDNYSITFNHILQTIEIRK